MSDLFAEQLQALRARSLHRKLREIGSAQGSIVDLVGKRLINFSSNDYLGLANDRRLREAAVAAINGVWRRRRSFALDQRNAVAAFATGERAREMERNTSRALL